MIKKPAGITMIDLPHRTGHEIQTFSFYLARYPRRASAAPATPPASSSRRTVAAAPPARALHHAAAAVAAAPGSRPAAAAARAVAARAAAAPPRPPPPDPLVEATDCDMGGRARVVAVRDLGGSRKSVRVVVEVDLWAEGASVLVGVNGADLRVAHVAHALLGATGPGVGSDLAIGVTLLDAPIEMSAFALIVEGRGRASRPASPAARRRATSAAPTTAGNVFSYGGDATSFSYGGGGAERVAVAAARRRRRGGRAGGGIAHRRHHDARGGRGRRGAGPLPRRGRVAAASVHVDRRLAPRPTTRWCRPLRTACAGCMEELNAAAAAGALERRPTATSSVTRRMVPPARRHPPCRRPCAQRAPCHSPSITCLPWALRRPQHLAEHDGPVSFGTSPRLQM